MIGKDVSGGSRAEAWIHGLPGEPQVGGAPVVVLKTMPFELRDRRITLIMETVPRVSASLRDLQRSRQILPHLTIVVRDGQGPRPDRAYYLSGARVETVIDRSVTFSFETGEVRAGLSVN